MPPKRKSIAMDLARLWPFDKEKFKGLYPPLIKRISLIIRCAPLGGMVCGLHCGIRSWEEQDEIFAIGRTIQLNKKIRTNKRGGGSWHQYGLASDLVFWVAWKNGKNLRKPEWSWDGRLQWRRLGHFGEAIGLTWGGGWKMGDKPHFQLTGGLSIAEAKMLHMRGGIPAVWAEVDRRLKAKGIA